MDWDQFNKLVEETVSRLRESADKPAEIRAAIRHYLSRGSKLGMSPTILWDYFCVSHPGIVGRAGYSGAGRDTVIEEFEYLSRQKFRDPG